MVYLILYEFLRHVNSGIVFFKGCYVGDQGLAAVGQSCKQLEDLNLRFCEGLTDAGLVELAHGCGKSLKALGIAACAKITDISLEAVGLHCKSLETLSLDSEFMHNKGVLAVAQGCPSLRVLKLQCINVTDDALKAVGTSCLSLEILALYSFQRFTDKLVLFMNLSYLFFTCLLDIDIWDFILNYFKLLDQIIGGFITVKLSPST